jgi:threonine dehydratase
LTENIELAEIEAVAEQLVGIITRTPTMPSRTLSEILGSQVYLKLENLQRTGSFKIRGATFRLSRLSEEERARGVVAASAGNHAQGVALAAKSLGIKATIFMPAGAPVPKMLATKDYGADVVLEGETISTSLRLAAEFAEQTGAIFVHPFDHRDIIVGQGTLGLEVVDDVPEVDTIVCGIGGGGVIAGIAVAAKARAAKEGREVRVIGVQAENVAPVPLSLKAGHPIEVEGKTTIADGILVSKPGVIPLEIISDYVDEVVTVSEEEITRAILLLLERSKVVVEPAGAVGVAAIMAGKVQDAGTTVAVLTGGNIDPLLLQRVIAHGLAASDRYLTLRIPLPDRPGQLARITELISQAGANVIEVMHDRHGRHLQLSDLVLQMSIETRGAEHRDATLKILRDAGYAPEVVIA